MTTIKANSIIITTKDRSKCKYWKFIGVTVDNKVIVQKLTTGEIFSSAIANTKRTVIVDSKTIKVNLDIDERVIHSSKLSGLLYG